ncbi:nicotinate phosphoribosyltransferase [Actinosynnema sp. NPDC059335]|uniref:nicotinate phosphoribosyltransferase n=1 Tax=Actinosynnema sp. NPDC059335 TaxID=3346804 RepID=UPI00366D344F
MTALCTDLYEIRMAVSYLRRAMTDQATFSLFVRRLPVDRGYLVATGLADCLDFLDRFGFTEDELAYLGREVGLDRSATTALRGLRFTGDVRAVPEGRVVFAGEPVLEVTAPIAEAQLVETALLNFVTFQTAVASKAARCRVAAGTAALVDFAARRTHGLEAAAAVARASAVVGFEGTSYVEAARRYGLTVTGTMAHSYVEAFPDERAAFRAFADDFPDDAVLLVDTYDTETGVRHAVDVTRPVGVRLDSGDLLALSRRAREVLDATGLPRARIVAGGGLDEYRIAELVARGAPIDVFGVGTRMGVSADAPSLDSAYKLVEYGGRPVMKLSAGKVTAPGRKQVFRGDPRDGDLLGLHDEAVPPGREPLLVPVMAGGARLGPRRSAHQSVLDARSRFHADLEWLPAAACRLARPEPVTVRTTDRLATLTDEVRTSLRDQLPGRS